MKDKTVDMLLLIHAKDFLIKGNVGHVSKPYLSARIYENYFQVTIYGCTHKSNAYRVY